MLSPMATEIERQSVAWIAELLGYPTDCGGLLVCGGNMANMVALWAARAKKAPTDVRTVGARGGAQMRVYVSEATSFVDYGPQNSRGFRALKVWLALKQVGRSGYAQMISEDMRLAGALNDAVAEHPDLEAMSHGLSITTFRYIPPDLREGAGDEAVATYLNDLNKEIQARMELGGEAFVSNAVIKGRYALRACIVNFNTDIDDVRALPGIVVRVGQNADRVLRAEGTALRGSL